MAAVEATDWAIDGTVIWASRAEGRVARAGLAETVAASGRGGIARAAVPAAAAGADASIAGLVDALVVALVATILLLLAGVLTAAVWVSSTGETFFAAGDGIAVIDLAGFDFAGFKFADASGTLAAGLPAACLVTTDFFVAAGLVKAGLVADLAPAAGCRALGAVLAGVFTSALLAALQAALVPTPAR